MGRKFNPNAPRHGKFSLNDIREYLGHWKRTYSILKELGWQVPWGYLFTPQEAYTILMVHHTKIGRKRMRNRSFQKLLPKDDRPLLDDPHDIMPPEHYTPQPKGFAQGKKRSLTRPKRLGRKTTRSTSKRVGPKG